MQSFIRARKAAPLLPTSRGDDYSKTDKRGATRLPKVVLACLALTAVSLVRHAERSGCGSEEEEGQGA